MTVTNTFKIECGGYTAPLCTITDISPEGVLCNSFGGNIEKLGNSVEYVWGDEE